MKNKTSDATIDELIANSTPKGRNSTKSNNPLKAAEKKPSGKLPAMVEQGTRTYNVAKMLQQGWSVSDIVDKYGIPAKEIKSIISKALLEIYDDAAPIMLNWSLITFNRLEAVIKVVMEKIVDDEGYINDPMIERLQTLITQQMEVYKLAMPKGKDGGSASAFNETMRSDSPLYQVGMDEREEAYSLPDGVDTEREREIADLDNPLSGGIVYQ